MSMFETPVVGTAGNLSVSIASFDAAVNAAIAMEADARATALQAVIAANGTVYATVAAGLAATASGGTFLVAAPDGAGIRVYQDSAGTAVLLTTLVADQDVARQYAEAAAASAAIALAGSPYRVDSISDLGRLRYSGATGSQINVSAGAIVEVVGLGSYEVLPIGAASSHLNYTGGGGVMLNVSAQNSQLTPGLFGAFGVASVGDLDVVGHAAIPNEIGKLQNLFDFAMLTGIPVVFDKTNRDYGIGGTIYVRPQANRNRGNTNATVSGGLLALRFSNIPSISVSNPGNSRIVAKASMQRMIYMCGNASYNSVEPHCIHWVKMNLNANGLAAVGFETEWSYRNHYDTCRVFGAQYGWQSKQDSGSLWYGCDTNCTEAGIWLDNTGDCTVMFGDTMIQKYGIIHGSGSNTRVIGVTFTGNKFDNPELVAIKLFGGSSAATSWQTKNVHISGCEAVGVDWLCKGDDDDDDGSKEIWNISLVGNHVVRNSLKPDIGLLSLRGAYGVHLSGNGHGDLFNAWANGPSVYLSDCQTISIADAFHRISGTAIEMIGCVGATIGSTFANCGQTLAEPIIDLNSCNEVSVCGSSAHWPGSSPAATAFVEETGTSNRNRATGNAIDTTKMARPYVRIGDQSLMRHEYIGTADYGGGTIANGSGYAFTVPVSGARVGDRASVSFGTTLNGLRSDVQIYGSGSARVSIRNDTGSSQTIAACTVTVVAESI